MVALAKATRYNLPEEVTLTPLIGSDPADIPPFTG